jgi:hypothetical protein
VLVRGVDERAANPQGYTSFLEELVRLKRICGLAIDFAKWW